MPQKRERKPRANAPRYETLGLITRPQTDGRAPSRHAALALVQFAPRKGEVDANIDMVADALRTLARDGGSFPDVVVFPETALSGYFVEGGVREVAMPAETALRRLSTAARNALGSKQREFDIVVGFYEDDGGKLYNSALYATLGKQPRIAHVHRKMFLPTYGVFDEERFVSRGRSIETFRTPYGTAAILICEDACHSLAVAIAALRGASIVFIPSASPGRGLADAEPANVRMWRDIMRVSASEYGIFFAYAGLLGFEGGKGFTGASRLVGPFGDVRVEAPFDAPAIIRADVGFEDVAAARAALPLLGDLETNLSELVEMLQSDSERRRQRPQAARGKARR